LPRPPAPHVTVLDAGGAGRASLIHRERDIFHDGVEAMAGNVALVDHHLPMATRRPRPMSNVMPIVLKQGGTVPPAFTAR
jgi:hypothetical protein